MKGSKPLLLAAMLSLPLLANAAEPAQCSTVNFSDVGWTDITATTALASMLNSKAGRASMCRCVMPPDASAAALAGCADVRCQVG